MGFESSPQSSFRFERPEGPPIRKKRKKNRKKKKELTPEENERLQQLIQRELTWIDNPDNKNDAILRMSSLADKYEIAKLRIWREFTGEPTVEYHDHYLD
jgi:hypothetical protein